MSNQYGPWATPIDTGMNPRLSTFWKKRLRMLAPVSKASAALSSRNLSWLAAAGSLLIILPTFHSIQVLADDAPIVVEKKQVEGKGKEGVMDRVVTVEQLEGSDVIVIKGRKKDVESALKVILEKKPAETEKTEKKTGAKDRQIPLDQCGVDANSSLPRRGIR
jgi:hypothetical protein